MTHVTEWTSWEQQFEQFLLRTADAHDAAHDLAHVRRVVATAKTIGQAEAVDMAVVVPAAWLHDCVIVAKNSPRRAQASRLAAQTAVKFLQTTNYPHRYAEAIYHAIEAHSFAANIPPQTREAQVVQDADRLDALGAIGIARCLMLGGAMGKRLYDPHDPFPITRPPDDTVNTLDHFYTKLLHLADSVTTPAGRVEAHQRTAFMQHFLAQLQAEL